MSGRHAPAMSPLLNYIRQRTMGITPVLPRLSSKGKVIFTCFLSLNREWILFISKSLIFFWFSNFQVFLCFAHTFPGPWHLCQGSICYTDADFDAPNSLIYGYKIFFGSAIKCWFFLSSDLLRVSRLKNSSENNGCCEYWKYHSSKRPNVFLKYGDLTR